MRKLFVVCILLFSSFNQTLASERPVEYARQAFHRLELPLYSLHLLKELPKYLVNQNLAEIYRELPESMSMLEWTALVHLGLFFASIYESQTYEVPGLTHANGTLLDQSLIAENEMLMPGYGAIVVFQKMCGKMGLCDAKGFMNFLLDQYFAVESVLKPVLETTRTSLNNGTAISYPLQDVVEVPGFYNLSTGASTMNTLNFAFGFAQLTTAMTLGRNHAAYAEISHARAVYLVAFFSWIGLSNIPMLVDQSILLAQSSPKLLQKAIDFANRMYEQIYFEEKKIEL